MKKFTWLGKSSEDMSHEELCEAVLFLGNENDELKKELAQKSINHMNDLCALALRQSHIV